MLDIKLLREDLASVKQKLINRNEDIAALESFAEIDQKRLELIRKTEELKCTRNQVSRDIAISKRNKIDTTTEQQMMCEVGDEISVLDEQLRKSEQLINQILLSLPNIPDESVPVGSTEEDNVVLRTEGVISQFDFSAKPHWEIGNELKILDFERAAKVTGSRFVFYCGLGARLERALMNFMLDLHTEEHGYTEMLPPYIVSGESMYGAGEFPKFKDDSFALKNTNNYLIPTAETPITNYHRDEILTLEELPKKYAIYSSCFRSESNSAGRDTRGLVRLHQFQKVELMKITLPEDADQELEKLLANAERILQLLELPYRVMLMCTGDLGFHAQKKYDLEVWLPGCNTYREISSCSKFGDFQARRAKIRYRPSANEKPQYLHTINGSGLAIGRTVAAILENYQQEDGSVLIPQKLQPYMGVDRISLLNT